VTSQLPVALWHEALGEPTVADAILDRLLHNAHRIELCGESMRKARSSPSSVPPPRRRSVSARTPIACSESRFNVRHRAMMRATAGTIRPCRAILNQKKEVNTRA
jgi:hypothetical protein